MPLSVLFYDWRKKGVNRTFHTPVSRNNFISRKLLKVLKIKNKFLKKNV